MLIIACNGQWTGDWWPSTRINLRKNNSFPNIHESQGYLFDVIGMVVTWKRFKCDCHLLKILIKKRKFQSQSPNCHYIH